MNNFIEFLIIIPSLYLIFYLLYRLFKKLFIVLLIPLLFFNFTYADILYYHNLDNIDGFGQTEPFKVYSPVKFKKLISYLDIGDIPTPNLEIRKEDFSYVDTIDLNYKFLGTKNINGVDYNVIEYYLDNEFILEPGFLYIFSPVAYKEVENTEDVKKRFLNIYFYPPQPTYYLPLGELYIEDFTSNFSLSQVFGVASSVLAGGTWILIALALGVMLAVFFAGKSITWIKKGLRKR